MEVKEVFKLLARYNSITNTELLTILEGLEPSKLTEDLGSYYGSILGLLNHIATADLNWLRGYGKNINSLEFVIPMLEKIPFERKDSKELNWSTLAEFKSVRLQIDNIIERVIEELTPSQYTSVLVIEGRRGRMEYVTWRYLLHLFNHHTHHRGAVAVLLDQLNIENDYSNLLWKI